ncbi:MAG: carbohydrate ABC transporter permease [Firmicutes bacterium]|nr:carbohydrate ABC transporter permease [Bacillota bacterium]
MLSASFTRPVDLSSWPPHLLPPVATWANYREAVTSQDFGLYLRNSAVVSLAATFWTLLLGALAAYPLGRMRLPGRQLILLAVLGLSMFPSLAVLLPLFSLLQRLGWLNSYPALILPYTAFNLPITIWILATFFRGIPRELEEAAQVDGAGLATVLGRVILPLAGPGLGTAGILVFIADWTEFLFALTFNSESAMRTLPVGIALFGGQYLLPWGTIFAGAAIAILPPVLLVVLFQRWVVAGLTAGALKG